MGQCFSADGGGGSAPAMGKGKGVGDMFGYPTDFDAHYDTGKELGRGTFGTTYLCTKKNPQPGSSAKEHTYVPPPLSLSLDELVINQTRKNAMKSGQNGGAKN